MKTDIIQQEILLSATSTFSNRNWQYKETPQAGQTASNHEKLEEACWNGLLDELLPGIVEKSPSGKQLYLWQIRRGNAFLEIELCEYPMVIDQYLSIDPYAFASTMNGN
jgi:hypothetical protein